MIRKVGDAKGVVWGVEHNQRYWAGSVRPTRNQGPADRARHYDAKEHLAAIDFVSVVEKMAAELSQANAREPVSPCVRFGSKAYVRNGN